MLATSGGGSRSCGEEEGVHQVCCPPEVGWSDAAFPANPPMFCTSANVGCTLLDITGNIWTLPHHKCKTQDTFEWMKLSAVPVIPALQAPDDKCAVIVGVR